MANGSAADRRAYHWIDGNGAVEKLETFQQASHGAGGLDLSAFGVLRLYQKGRMRFGG